MQPCPRPPKHDDSAPYICPHNLALRYAATPLAEADQMNQLGPMQGTVTRWSDVPLNEWRDVASVSRPSPAPPPTTASSSAESYSMSSSLLNPNSSAISTQSHTHTTTRSLVSSRGTMPVTQAAPHASQSLWPGVRVNGSCEGENHSQSFTHSSHMREASILSTTPTSTS